MKINVILQHLQHFLTDFSVFIAHLFSGTSQSVIFLSTLLSILLSLLSAAG